MGVTSARSLFQQAVRPRYKINPKPGTFNPKGANLIWRSVALSGAFNVIWRYQALSGAIWRYLTLSDVIWRHLALSDAIWRYLALSGVIWRYLALAGAILWLPVAACQTKLKPSLNQA